MEKSLNFSNIRFADLEGIVKIRLGNLEAHKHKFDEWFQYDYKLNDDEIGFFCKLIEKHKLRLTSYSEEKIKMRFLALILDRVDFSMDEIQDWYDASIRGVINNVEIKGFADFMVATGQKEPQEPYFFIQEFKPSIPDRDPETQLLVELLLAIEKNQVALMRGAYIVGQNWRFVILEKTGENHYEYFISDQLDSLNIEHLKQIYICLQAIKLKYCRNYSGIKKI